MRMAIIISLGVTIALIALYVFFQSPHSVDTEPRKTETEMAADIGGYFETALLTIAMERVGQPREGFTPEILIQAFPVFLPEDFEGVEAMEGSYSVKDGQAVFVEHVTAMQTSAATTISPAGYETLLKNVALRLNFLVRTKPAVDALVEEISEGGR